MHIARYGLAATQPAGWHVEIDRRPREVGQATVDGVAGVLEDITHPILHACTRPLPVDRGDFGSGAVDILGSDDVFVALVEYGHEVADEGLFANNGIPRIAPSQFDPNQLQRPLPGRSAVQHFFSVGGRAFCLFTVLGAHSRRMATAPRAARFVSTLQVTEKSTMLQKGGMP